MDKAGLIIYYTDLHYILHYLDDNSVDTVQNKNNPHLINRTGGISPMTKIAL